jgi:hypothetical protein
LARKSNTGRELVPLLHPTLNTNWLLLLSTQRTVLPARGVDPLSPHTHHLSTASWDIPQHPSRQMRVRISPSVNLHTIYSPDCYLSRNSRAELPSRLQDTCPWQPDYRPSTLQRECNGTARQLPTSCLQRNGAVLWVCVSVGPAHRYVYDKRDARDTITCHWCYRICYIQIGRI